MWVGEKNGREDTNRKRRKVSTLRRKPFLCIMYRYIIYRNNVSIAIIDKLNMVEDMRVSSDRY